MKHENISLINEVGLGFLGKGINILTWEPGNSPVSAPLIIPTSGNTTTTPIKELKKTQTTAKSYASFLHQYSASLGINGSYGSFSGSLKTKFSGSDLQSVDTSFASFSAIYTGEVLNLGQERPKLRDMLTADCKAAIDTGDIDQLFQTYGTHLATKVYVGAMLEYFCNSIETEHTSERDFSVDAEAKYETALYEVGAQASISDKTKEEAKHAEGRNQLTVSGGSAETAGALSGCAPKSFQAWLATVDANPAFLKFGEDSLVPVWELAETDKRRDDILDGFKRHLARHPMILTISKTGAVAPHPQARISLADIGDGIDPGSYKMLSGGACDNWSGDGNMLTASFPDSATSWTALGKDHQSHSPADITVFLTAIYDPMNIWDVACSEASGAEEQHPSASVNLIDPSTYKLVGGGSRVTYHGDGCLLTSSYPTTDANGQLTGWYSAAKDHNAYDKGTVTAYAIGLRCLIADIKVDTKLFTAASYEPQSHPSISVKVDKGTMTGGGAYDEWTGDGNLLTGSYPVTDNEWMASGKDHFGSDPSNIKAYAIALVTS